MARLSQVLIHESVLVVIAGGNCHALLQSFEEKPVIRDVLKNRIHGNRIVLMTWSAGSTAVGQWTAHTKDSVATLRHDTGYRTCIGTGLGFIPRHSFGSHMSRDHRSLTRYVRHLHSNGRMHPGEYVFLLDCCYVAFHGFAEQVYWNSDQIDWITNPCGV